MSSESELIERKFDGTLSVKSTENVDDQKRVIVGIGGNDGTEPLLVLTHNQLIDIMDIVYSYRTQVIKEIDYNGGITTMVGQALDTYKSKLFDLHQQLKAASDLMDEGYTN